jgi:hypothetical protein
MDTAPCTRHTQSRACSRARPARLHPRIPRSLSRAPEAHHVRSRSVLIKVVAQRAHRAWLRGSFRASAAPQPHGAGARIASQAAGAAQAVGASTHSASITLLKRLSSMRKVAAPATHRRARFREASRPAPRGQAAALLLPVAASRRFALVQSTCLAAERVEADRALASRRRGAAAPLLLALRRALLREGLAECNEIAAVGALHVLLGVRVDRVHAHNVLDAGLPAGRGTRGASGPRMHGLSRGAVPPARRCPNRTPASRESPACTPVLCRAHFCTGRFRKAAGGVLWR